MGLAYTGVDIFIELEVKNKKPPLSAYKHWLMVMTMLCEQLKMRGFEQVLALTQTDQNQKFMHFLGWEYLGGHPNNEDRIMVREL